MAVTEQRVYHGNVSDACVEMPDGVVRAVWIDYDTDYDDRPRVPTMQGVFTAAPGETPQPTSHDDYGEYLNRLFQTFGRWPSREGRTMRRTGRR